MLTLSTPPAIIERAETACARYTWDHPQGRAMRSYSYGNRRITVACERFEDNSLEIQQITISLYLPEGDEIGDPNELLNVEQETCAKFKGVPCEVILQ